MPVRECDPSCRWVEALPPHSSIAGLANVGEHGVFGNGGHGVGVGLVRGAGCHTKETVLWVDGSQSTCRDKTGLQKDLLQTFAFGGPKLKLHGGPRAKSKHLKYCIVKMQSGTETP